MRTGMTSPYIFLAVSSAPRAAAGQEEKAALPAPHFRPRGNKWPRKVTRQDLRDAAEKYKNWGKWGPDDEIGTLNYTSADDIVAAARLVRKGKVISLALNFDHTGPQGAKSKYPAMGRTNPIHTMLRTGTDAYSGVLDQRGIRAADDMVVMPLQCGTQWDGLGHVFYENNMWNGYDCREVTSAGAQKCGIEKTKNKMVGRGVFLDVARYEGMDVLDDGYGITCEISMRPRRSRMSSQARRLHHRAHRPDGALLRRRELGRLSGRRRAGLRVRDAGMDRAHPSSPRSRATPGAARCARTRPKPGINQPWHWITIPIMGMTMGEIFYVKDLAEDCAADGVYEFLFVAPAIPITGAVGSPANPLAIRVTDLSMLGHNRKMTGAECLADMLKGYGVTHVFMVPAVLRRTFAEMERRTDDQAHPCARREIRRLHGGRLRARLRQARRVHGAGDRRPEPRGRPARRLARAFAGDRVHRRARAGDEVPQGVSGDRRRAGVRAGDQVQRHGR